MTVLNKPDAIEVGLPFTGPVVRRIVMDLFAEQAQWKSGPLVDRVARLHRSRGGRIEADPAIAVRRTLQILKQEGILVAPGHGWWRLNTPSMEDQCSEVEGEADDPDRGGMEEAEDVGVQLQPERTIGTGSESIYLYFNPNDKRLAELEGRDTWECKIGRTGTIDPSRRILGQGTATALSHKPTVGLLILTADSAALESALHSSLRLVSAEVPDSLGTEWFCTSPSRVEAWYVAYRAALATIDVSAGLH